MDKDRWINKIVSLFSPFNWKSVTLVVVLSILIFSFWPKATANYHLPDKIDFNYHIRPILSQNCYTCHGPDSTSRAGDLRLDNFESAIAKLPNGHRAIVPGKPGKSTLIQRITAEDAELTMPPPESKKELTEREIALLRKWIKQGAKWKPYWAFIPPEMPDMPTSLKEVSVAQKIDYLVDKRIESKNLESSGQADKNTLIRRVAYLLTGLPPSVKELNRFLEDASPDSYEQMLDYYLASPHFGERWARHWMDLVRYAESMGHEGDYNISHPFEYRDYLIRAFNQDVPYDLFVKEHLAGDMLEDPRRNPEEGFNESILGTAYFFLGEGKHSPVDIKLEEAEKIDNMIDVTSKTFQALTVSCAKCHDHKFDPIPTTDYYAMYGMIASSRLGPISARVTAKQEEQVKRLEEIQGEIRTTIGRSLISSLDQRPSAEFINLRKQFINDLEAPKTNSENFQMIEDFRDGEWDGWYSHGFAFGNQPVLGKPILDSMTNRIVRLNAGKASSLFYGKGVNGVLRSPNFVLDQDSIAVRARGYNGLIRIIIENFQVIQDPLWGDLQKQVNSPDWETYTMDVSMAKGLTAYLQFTPGNYGPYARHVYDITTEDYIELEYALTFSNELPLIPPLVPTKSTYSQADKKTAIEQWIRSKATLEDTKLVENILLQNKASQGSSIRPLVEEYESILPQLYDSTHFIGMNEGDGVFSPVFIRGSHKNLSEEKVAHRFLSAVSVDAITFPEKGSGRLAWAESVVHPDNPLTARIIVNRLWHHLFGRGIVETVDNFGLQGKLPSHPDLLDFLAIKMVEEGWSMKGMIRHILMSNTFQRSTKAIDTNLEHDPNNIYLHHFPLRRLEGEAIRDGMLKVAGQLDTQMYGEPVLVHLTQFMTGRGRPRTSGPLDGKGRRSIYTSIRRNFISPMMLAFDMPIPFTTFGKRNTTNVPAQSLTLMNDPFVIEQAGHWADLILSSSDQSIEERVNTIYQSAFSRVASKEELEKARLLLEAQAGNFNCNLEEMLNDKALWTSYCLAIFNLKEFIHLL